MSAVGDFDFQPYKELQLFKRPVYERDDVEQYMEVVDTPWGEPP